MLFTIKTLDQKTFTVEALETDTVIYSSLCHHSITLSIFIILSLYSQMNHILIHTTNDKKIATIKQKINESKQFAPETQKLIHSGLSINQNL